MRTKKLRTGSWLGTLLAGLLLVLPHQADALSDADLFLYPMSLGTETVLDISNPAEFELLTFGVDYVFEKPTLLGGSFTNTANPADPSTWDLLNWRATVSFPVITTGNGEASPTLGDFVLVLTGLGNGLLPVSSPAGRADAGHVRGSFMAVAPTSSLDLILVFDGESGQIPDDGIYGSVFPALRFPAVPGTSYTFDFQVALRGPLPILEDGSVLVDHFNAVFATVDAVPEPSQGVLLALGVLASLWLHRRHHRLSA